MAFAPIGHPLATKHEVALREAAAYALILPSRDSSVREAVEAIAHRERLLLHTRYEANYMPTALAFVRAGLGIAILPESAANLDSEAFAKIPLKNRFSTRQIELLQKKSSTLSPAAEIFAKHLRSNFVQLKGAAASRSRVRARGRKTIGDLD